MRNACGTTAGYRQHRRKDETPCGRCRSAHAAAERDARARRGGATGERRILVPEALFAAMYLDTSVTQQLAAEATLGSDRIDRMVRAYDRAEP